MNEKDNKKKFSEFMQKTADVSKRVASSTYEGTKKVVGKIATDTYEGTQKMAKKIKEDNEKKEYERLSPLFLEDYQSESFNIPNVIKIVDDAVRRDNKMCEGAIGWLAMEGAGKTNLKKTEVLYLYDEAREISGIPFFFAYAYSGLSSDIATVYIRASQSSADSAKCPTVTFIPCFSREAAVSL
jgi:hypothetical protein